MKIPVFEEFLEPSENDEKEYVALKGEWEIDSILDVTEELPEGLDEKIIISADFGDVKIGIGKVIYITARLVKRDGEGYSKINIGVIKTRVTGIFSTLNILNAQ